MINLQKVASEIGAADIENSYESKGNSDTTFEIKLDELIGKFTDLHGKLLKTEGMNSVTLVSEVRVVRFMWKILFVSARKMEDEKVAVFEEKIKSDVEPSAARRKRGVKLIDFCNKPRHI